MPRAKSLAKYPSSYFEIALSADQDLVFPLKDKKKAQRLRFDLYSFRTALEQAKQLHNYPHFLRCKLVIDDLGDLHVRSVDDLSEDYSTAIDAALTNAILSRPGNQPAPEHPRRAEPRRAISEQPRQTPGPASDLFDTQQRVDHFAAAFDAFLRS